MLGSLKAHLRDPEDLLWIALCIIVGYYLVTAVMLHAIRHKRTKGWWRLVKKNGVVDIITSFFWVVSPVVLIANMLVLAKAKKLGLDLLLIYYGLFLFLFSFLYCMAEWHFPGSLIGTDDRETEVIADGKKMKVPARYQFNTTWKDEFMYFMISLQTQTTLGYNRVRPNHWTTDLIAGVQALVTLFLVTVAIAQAVSFVS